jgi:hypothetical protein
MPEPAYTLTFSGARTMRTLLKFLLGMIILATIVGIVYYIFQMMSGGMREEPLDIVE